jgi:hypothetical protein
MGRNTIRGPQGEQGVLVPTYLFDGSDWTKYLTYPLIEGFGKPIQNGLIITHNRTSVRHTHARHDRDTNRGSHTGKRPRFSNPQAFWEAKKRKKEKNGLRSGASVYEGHLPLASSFYLFVSQL